MDMISMRRSYCSSSYIRVEKEDPEEKKHRRALFLIDKQMLKADAICRRRRRTSIRVRTLRIKLGARLKKMRRRIQITISAARARVSAYRKSLRLILSLWRQQRQQQGLLCVGTKGNGSFMAMQQPPFFTVEYY